MRANARAGVFKGVAVAVTILLSALDPIAAQDAGEGIFPFQYEMVELANGFRAYLIRVDEPGRIAYVSVVRTGSRDEVEEGRSGYAHFFEHMMFRGTAKYPLYDAVTSELGADRNANTSNDRTIYYLVGNREYLERIVDLESDRFQNLAYSEPDFRTEAGAILGEYSQGALTPSRWLDERVRQTAYDHHTYRHTTIGLEPDVRAMPEGYEYSRSFYERFYRPENVVLLIAGDFEFSEARALIEEYYGSWEPGYVTPAVEEEPAQEVARNVTVRYPGRTLPVVSINYKAPAWSATDRLAVATEVLGRVAFGSNSDLYRRLVLQEQRLQGLRADFGLARDPALVEIQATVRDPRDVESVKAEIQETIERFQTDPADEKLLEDTKNNMKYRYLMDLETGQQVAFSLIQYIVNTGMLEAVNDYYRTLSEITASDLTEAARRVLVDSGRTTVTMVQAEGAR